MFKRADYIGDHKERDGIRLGKCGVFRRRRRCVKRYKATLDQAELNLTYTRIMAPVAGVLSKRTVEVGQNVKPGQILRAIFMIIPRWFTTPVLVSPSNRHNLFAYL